MSTTTTAARIHAGKRESLGAESDFREALAAGRVVELDYLCNTPAGTLAAYGVAAVRGFFSAADVIKAQPRQLEEPRP